MKTRLTYQDHLLAVNKYFRKNGDTLESLDARCIPGTRDAAQFQSGAYERAGPKGSLYNGFSSG